MTKLSANSTILHTVTAKCKNKVVKILLDHGSNSSVITAAAAKRLNIGVSSANNTLQIDTLNGESTVTDCKADIPLTMRNPVGKISNDTKATRAEVIVQCYVIDSDLTVDKPNVEVSAIWPNLAPNLITEVTQKPSGGPN